MLPSAIPVSCEASFLDAMMVTRMTLTQCNGVSLFSHEVDGLTIRIVPSLATHA